MASEGARSARPATTGSSRPSALVPVVLAATLVLAACSGGSASHKANGPSSTSSTTSAAASATPIAGTTHQLGQNVYFGGFRVSLGTARLHSTAAGGLVVDIDAVFFNEGTDRAALIASFDLASAASHYQVDDALTTVPTVAGGGASGGTVSFAVDNRFTFDDAVLTIGRTTQEQAVVPFGVQSQLVDLAPTSFAASGAASVGPLKVQLTGGMLRADLPTKHEQAGKGQRFLTVTFDATDTSSSAGGFSLTNGNLGLRLASGAPLAPVDGPVVVINPTATLRALHVAFLVAAPGNGAYQFVVTEQSGSSHATSTVGITVPPG
jgi:hypothetical protein